MQGAEQKGSAVLHPGVDDGPEATVKPKTASGDAQPETSVGEHDGVPMTSVDVPPVIEISDEDISRAREAEPIYRTMSDVRVRTHLFAIRRTRQTQELYQQQQRQHQTAESSAAKEHETAEFTALEVFAHRYQDLNAFEDGMSHLGFAPHQFKVMHSPSGHTHVYIVRDLSRVS